jgi:hypothetical protein
MKKIYTTLVAVFAIVQFSCAQWLPNGSDIYFNTGNVGIGTSNPGAKLEVSMASNDGVLLQEVERISTTGRLAGSGTPYRGTLLSFSDANNPTLTAAIGGLREAPGTNFLGDLAFYTASVSGSPTTNVSSLSETMRITSLGNVGIGTTSPTAKLDIAGSVRSSLGDQSVSALVLNNSNTSFDNSLLYGYTARTASSAFRLLDLRTSSGTTNAMYIDGNGNGFMAGNLAIGTTDPKGYKLAVNGSAIAESVTVKLHGSWPDYVFKANYSLPSLADVKTYIDKNYHLPDMPSEQDVAKNGINLGEIVKLQTKKIEELTLYLIEKDKQVTEQQKQNADQNQLLIEQQKINRSLQIQIDQLAKNKNK